MLMEEMARIRAHAMMLSLHSDICMPYLVHYATEEQKQRYLTRAITGETLLALAMTEPGTGSDLANIQTRALRDGDSYVLNGAKTFISNGQICDLCIVVAKTDPEADPLTGASACCWWRPTVPASSAVETSRSSA
jgi:acyl-CoA dehydrogenase